MFLFLNFLWNNKKKERKIESVHFLDGNSWNEFTSQAKIYTDISKDGMLAGPNIEQTKLLSDKTGIDIIASGGVSCMQDHEAVSDAGIHGAIIGKALYEKRVILSEAVEKNKK